MSLDLTVVDDAAADAARALVRRAQGKCDSILRKAVETLGEPLATMAGYHLGWCDAHGRGAAGSPGKSIRAALVLGTAEACGDADAGAPAAAAVELVHNFSLLHDDVMDGDRTRRGRPTVWSVWGVAQAILLGDALHALAIQVLAEQLGGKLTASAIARLEKTCVDLCRGQFQDCAWERRTEVSIEDYLHMAGGKTAALMGCACALGAVSAGADEPTIAAMERFGYELGLAFQVVDDVIGIWGDPQVTGKPVGNDLARRKATLPVVAALSSGCTAARELAQLYTSRCEMTPSEITRATTLVEVAGGKQAARQHADKRFQAAMAALPHGISTADLIALAHLITNRDR